MIQGSQLVVEYMHAKLLQSYPAVVQEGLSGEEYLRGLHKGQIEKRNLGGKGGFLTTHVHARTHRHTHTHTRVCTHAHTHACALTHAHTCTCMHTHTLTSVCTRTHLQAYAHAHTYTHSHARARAHSHTHALTHTYTHTHCKQLGSNPESPTAWL